MSRPRGAATREDLPEFDVLDARRADAATLVALASPDPREDVVSAGTAEHLPHDLRVSGGEGPVRERERFSAFLLRLGERLRGDVGAVTVHDGFLSRVARWRGTWPHR